MDTNRRIKVFHSEFDGWYIASLQFSPSGNPAFWQQSSPYCWRLGNLCKWVKRNNLPESSWLEQLPSIMKEARKLAKETNADQYICLSEGKLFISQTIQKNVYAIKINKNR